MKYLLSVAATVSAALLGLCVSPAQAQTHINARARHKGTYNFFRTEPNRHSRIIEKMPQGTPFVITGESGKYYSIVRTDGRTGWTARVNALIEGQSPSADTEEDGEEGHAAAPVVAVRSEPAVPIVVGKVREGVVPVVEPVMRPVSPIAPPVAPVVSHARHRAAHIAHAPKHAAPAIIVVKSHVHSLHSAPHPTSAVGALSKAHS